MRRYLFRDIGFLLAASLCLSIAQGQAVIEKKKRSSAPPLSDCPLPDGAITRLGTGRWRCASGAMLLQFVHDGTQLVVCRRDGIIQLFDSLTGQEVRQFGKLGDVLFVVASPDGTMLAMSTLEGARASDGCCVSLWSVATGKVTRSFHLGFSDLSGMTFAGTTRLLTWNGHGVIKEWDTSTGKTSRVVLENANESQKNQPRIVAVSVSPDEKTLVISSQSDKPNNLRHEFRRLSDGTRWGELLQDSTGFLGPVFTPDSQYFALTQSDAFYLYKSATLLKVRRIEDPAKAIRPASARFSPDGKLLAAIREDGTILVVDTSGGKKAHEVGESLPWNMTRGQRDLLAWSSSSKRIAQMFGPVTLRVWDPDHNRGTELARGHLGAILGLSVSSDGRTVASYGADYKVRSWTISSAEEQECNSLPSASTYGQLLSNGRMLIHINDGSLSVWDVGTKRFTVKIRDFKDPLPSIPFNISAQKKFLYYRDLENNTLVARYDLRSGVRLAGIEKNWIKDTKERVERLTSVIHGVEYTLGTIASEVRHVSKEERRGEPQEFIRLKKADDEPVFLWERKLDDYNITQPISLTPDDRAILAMNHDREQKTWLTILESLTGKERFRFVVPIQKWRDAHEYVHAYSASGDLLAVALKSGSTVLFDLRRAKEIARFDGRQGIVQSLSIKGEELLLTGGSDGTILIWDIRPHVQEARRPSNKLLAKDLARSWDELASRDVARAFKGFVQLVEGENFAVALIGKKLKPAVRVPRERIDGMINQLDSSQLSVRESSAHELRQIGSHALAALQKSLKLGKSVEFQRRVEAIIAEIDPYTGYELRDFRAIEILEIIGTREAQRILETLSRGAPDHKLTVDAQAAVFRLKRSAP